jgi:ABC-type sugar transport system ATPase subunit
MSVETPRGGANSDRSDAGTGFVDAGTTTVLDVRGLTKIYPGTVALKNLDFQLQRGEIRALLGKNGAGKSTFVEILSGTKKADAGETRICGRLVELGSPVQARQEGISTVHQEFSLFPDLSVLENITLGACARHGVISRKEQVRRATEALAQMKVEIDLDEWVGRLSSRDQQVTAIARALFYRPRVLILDEPTSALPAEAVDQLISLVRHLAAQGVSVIYVSHRLDEIPRVAHSVTVLRDGRLVDTASMKDTTPDDIVQMMLGRTMAAAQKSHSAARPVVALSVRNVSRARKLTDISFDLFEGEILGLWGAPGAGRTELLRLIFGLDRAEKGSIHLGRTPLTNLEPSALIKHGVGFSPDDRKRDGLVLMLSVAENIALASLDKLGLAGLIGRDRMIRVAEQQVERLSIKVHSLDSPVLSLSGGNQQKVVLGRWLAANVRLLLLDEPTKGIDIEAKAALYNLLGEVTRAGMSVVIAPTELEELFLVCDRVLILRRGSLAAQLPLAETSPQEVMRLALSGETEA